MPFSFFRVIFSYLVLLTLVACYSNPVRTAKIHENDEWIIQLGAVDNPNKGRGYNHPATLPPSQITPVLRGLYIEYEPRSLPFFSNQDEKEIKRSQIFNQNDSDTLASMLADGLEQAAKTEIVTFTKTTPISSQQESITSGGVFILGDELHIVISNSHVKQNIRQDVETYQTPAHLDPINPITSQPGRLVFQHRRLMRTVPDTESDFVNMWSGINWHIAVKYKQSMSSLK